MLEWGWVAWAVASGAGALLVRQQRDINDLKRKIKALSERCELLNEPWPSEGSEEEMQIEAARELCRKQGIKLSLYHAGLVLQKVRSDREKAKAKREN